MLLLFWFFLETVLALTDVSPYMKPVYPTPLPSVPASLSSSLLVFF